MKDPLEEEFHKAMLDIDRACKREIGFNSKHFRAMVSDHGGREAAKKLLVSPRVQSGFEYLWKRGRLDLSMEAVIVQPKYSPLFTPSEIVEAKNRLEMGRYDARRSARENTREE